MPKTPKAAKPRPGAKEARKVEPTKLTFRPKKIIERSIEEMEAGEMTTAQRYETFCQAYAHNWNAAEAARAAGYADSHAKVHGCYLLTKPNLRKRVAEIREQIVKDLAWDREKFLQHLMRLASRDDNSARTLQATQFVKEHLKIGESGSGGDDSGKRSFMANLHAALTKPHRDK